MANSSVALKEFEERLWGIVDDRVGSLLPVYSSLIDGSMPRPALVHWMGQLYLFIRPFKRFLAGILANCDDLEAEALIIENLWEESGEGRPGADHPSVMRRMPVALGIPEDEVDRLPPDPETADILDYFHRLSREEWWVEALAGVGIGLEASPLALQETGGEAAASMLATLLQDRYGLGEHDVEFFRMHVFEDVEHTRRTMEIIKRYASSPDVAERIENRVRDAAARLVSWMEALKEESYRRVPA